MSQCPKCGLQMGLHHSILPGCMYTTESPFTYPVVSPQRTWVGLTDEEMHECWDSPLTPLGMKHARMIEAKLKEKNQ